MAAETCTRHNLYYLDIVVIRVENKLFRIPKDILVQNSPVFADIFSISTGEAELDGSSDAKPLFLEQVTSTDFERLLGILYPMQAHPLLVYYPLTELAITRKADRSVDQSSWDEKAWMSVLGLADKWQMSGILNTALQNLRNIVPPTTKILFGQRYDYPSWVVEGFLSLCLCERPISQEEGHELGVDNLVKCAIVREKLWDVTARDSFQQGFRRGRLRAYETDERAEYGGPEYQVMAERLVRDVLGL